MGVQHKIGQQAYELAGRLRWRGGFTVGSINISGDVGFDQHGQSMQHAVVAQCSGAFRARRAVDHRRA